ncbi:autotransporter outer membrane beta-barrel domain-containing protein [Methyloligella solikamskensis]|uniref:Autotransporter outer membrane beta-barrel domain-containing protein n=1 Tax=Methyloligella solikamskensis TaxID=1177756 RepID=A0ABW3J9N2_9HYPH
MIETKKAHAKSAPDRAKKSILNGVRAAILASLPGATVLASPAYAQMACTTTNTSGCVAVPGMSQDMVKNRFGRTLATNPNQDRVTKRLNTNHWQADGNVETPFNMQEAGSGTRVETSLHEWRAALTDAERKRLQEAKENGGEDVKLPEPVRHQAPPVDVWVRSQSQSLDTSGDTRRNGDAVTTYVGADYKLNSDTLVGGMVQSDEADQHVVGTSEEVDGKAYMAGPYAAYRVTDKVIVDAKSLWGQSNDVARTGEDAASYATNRSLTQARVSGNWGIKKMQLTPSGAVTHITEDADIPVAGVGSEHIEETRVSIRPEIKRPFQAGENKKIEPFAYFESSLNVDDSDFTNAAPINKVGGGVALTKTDDYSIRATMDYTETMNSELDPSASGRVSVNVPIGNKP